MVFLSMVYRLQMNSIDIFTDDFIHVDIFTSFIILFCIYIWRCRPTSACVKCSLHPLDMFYTIIHIFRYHLTVQNILHNKVSCCGYVVLLYHKHDIASRLSSNGAMTNILHISYFLI